MGPAVFLQPVLTQPLARIVALLASLPGKIGDIYSAHYKYGVIFVESAVGAISLKIDFECSRDYGVSCIANFLPGLYSL